MAEKGSKPADEVGIKYKNRRLTVSYSRTINTGNYESEKIHAEFAADIQDGADVDQAYAQAYDLVTYSLEEQIKHLDLS